MRWGFANSERPQKPLKAAYTPETQQEQEQQQQQQQSSGVYTPEICACLVLSVKEKMEVSALQSWGDSCL